MSILEMFEYDRGRIFGIDLMHDNTEALFTECCDLYFSVGLNKDQVGLLIGELQSLHKKMRHSPNIKHLV